MKLSRKCEYALLILIQLSGTHGDGKPIPSSVLSEKNKIPRKFLDQIMSLLRKNGYVESVRGVTGGFRLSKPPGEISLAEIVRLIDGPIAPIASVSTYFYRQTPSEQNDRLISCFKDIRDYAAMKLETLTFDQLV